MKKIACSLVFVSVFFGGSVCSNPFKNAYNKVSGNVKAHPGIWIAGTATPVVLGGLILTDVYANQKRVLKAIACASKKLGAKAKKHPGFTAAIVVPIALAAVFGGEATYAAIKGRDCLVKKGWNKVFAKKAPGAPTQEPAPTVE